MSWTQYWAWWWKDTMLSLIGPVVIGACLLVWYIFRRIFRK